jgi:hypothetical protein
MVVWNLFFTTILLPLVTIALLALRRRQPFAPWLATVILACGVTGFGLLVAPWGWFGVPLRIVIAVLFVAALLLSLRRPAVAVSEEEAAPNPMRNLVKVLLGVFFGSVAIGVLRAHSVPPNTIDFGFPLTRGAYLVAHGGSESAANIHAQDAKQRYAVDLVKLNGAGMRARGIYPEDASRYAIFGDAVVSPCEGVVLGVVDGHPDAARLSLDEKNPLGNHVVLRCGDAVVTLAQLQRGSIAVRPGARVTRGAPLARVGNSGTSSEPHLHVHAERAGRAVPASFEGRWLVRNAIVRK